MGTTMTTQNKNVNIEASRCGLCLYFRSPKCTFANAPVEAQDSSCYSFFPLAERLEIFTRSRKREMEFAKKVEEL